MLADAQSKKTSPAKKTVPSTQAKQSKNTGKNSTAKPKVVLAVKGKDRKQTFRANANDKRLAQKDARKEKIVSTSAKASSKTQKDRSAGKDRAKVDPKDERNSKKLAESKKEVAERRRLERERQAAILAERRRREQAAREARERRLAFERGLRTETVANIAKDNVEGEDLQIRQSAINALGSHAGSVVVMEAQTGKVLTIVNQDWAVRDSVKPCSTIKLVTGVAGLNEGVINKENGSIRDTPSRRDLDDALAYSDNGYFQRAGSIVGNSKMIEYARELGLGQPTGLNMEGEAAGKLAIGNNNARIYSHGDDFEVSTVQLAVMVSAITNGGRRVIPRVPRNDVEKARFQTFYRHRIDLPTQNLRRVIPGMMGAAEYGTARRDMDKSLGVAGKTGSCISKGSWVGLFASVAPIENPKYSVVVITRGQSERGRYAAAVASKIYDALSQKIVRTDRNLAQTEFHLQPRHQTVTAIAAVPEEDEDDDGASIEAGGDVENIKPITQVPLVKADPRKLVTRTGNSKPVFPPVIITYDKDGREIKKTGGKPE